MFEVKLIRSYVPLALFVEHMTLIMWSGVQVSDGTPFTRKRKKKCCVERRYFRYESSQENKREWVGLFSKYYLVENR